MTAHNDAGLPVEGNMHFLISLSTLCSQMMRAMLLSLPTPEC